MTIVSAKLKLSVEVQEYIDPIIETVVGPTVPHTLDGSPVNSSGTLVDLTPSTTPPVTKVWSDRRTLGGTTETLDLTSLTGFAGLAVDLTGLKIVGIYIKAADANNAAGLQVEPGSSNGLNVFGTSGLVIVPPGGCEGSYKKAGGPTVGSGAKTVKVTGTAADVYTIVILAGTA